MLTWAQIAIGILYSGIAHERQSNFRHRKKKQKRKLRYRQCFRCGSFLPTAYADISCEMFVYLKTNEDKVLPLNLVYREENYNILVLLNDY